MKVIHILNELKFSGAEIMYVDAAPEFMKLGCELSVLAKAENLGEYAPYFEKAGYTVFHKPFPATKGICARARYFKQLYEFFKTRDFDVIHIHASGFMFSMSLIAYLCGIKAVYTFHNVFPTHFYSYPWHVFKRWCAKNVFGCTFHTISQSVYNNEQKVFFNRTNLIYNWYGYRRFYPAKQDEKRRIRESLQIGMDAVVIISVGGCSPVKRHTDILKALPKLISYYPNLLYLHLGKGETELNEISLAEELSVEKNVRFCGNISDVRQYLIVSDIYLMPSKFEGIPITTIEAMACKIPCILYDVPGLRDFNKEGDNAILIQPDYRLLADYILMLLGDKNKSMNLSENAKNFVDKTFSLKNNVKKIFNLYQP